MVVVGAGAMGSAAAWWLARRGRDVVLIDRFQQGHDRGSSHGSARIFRLAYAEPDYVHMAQQSLPLWRELEGDTGRTLLDTTGGVDHGHPESVGAVAAGLTAAGAAHETLTVDQATERWPGMRFAGSVLFQPDAGRCRADDALRAMQERAAALGAEIRFSEPVTSLQIEDDRAVALTDAGEYIAPVAVVTGGPWAEKLLTGHARLPAIEVTQESVFHFETQPDAQWPAFIHHRRPYIYGLQAPEGVKVAEHHNGPRTDPDGRNFAVDPQARARIRQYVEDWLPGLVPSVATEATCLYSTTPTDDFVLDRVGPLVIGAGFSGHGFKFTPLIGRILADLVDGQPTPYDRFALRR